MKGYAASLTLRVHQEAPRNSPAHTHLHTCKPTHVFTSMSLLKNLTC